VHKANCLSLVGPAIECTPADANTATIRIYIKHERRTINRSGGGGAAIAIEIDGADRFQSKHSVENIETAEPSTRVRRVWSRPMHATRKICTFATFAAGVVKFDSQKTYRRKL